MFSVYILYSPSIDQFYVGQTEYFAKRFTLYLDKAFVGNFTKRASGWELFYEIFCNTRTQALEIESHIKRMKSRQYLKNLKTYPDITEKLKMKYR
jgi:putative endonuclease